MVQYYLKRTRWHSNAWDHALIPPSGGGGIGSTESFVLRRERVLVRTPPSTFLLGLFDNLLADGGTVSSGPYSSSRKVDAGEGTREASSALSVAFSSMTLLQSLRSPTGREK